MLTEQEFRVDEGAFIRRACNGEQFLVPGLGLFGMLYPTEREKEEESKKFQEQLSQYEKEAEELYLSMSEEEIQEVLSHYL